MLNVKICGVSRLCDIDALNRSKPDYAGFVFAKSRRQISSEQAEILRKSLSPTIISVGVFVNEPKENILSLVRAKIIGAIQLHGNESEEFVREIKDLSGVCVIKAVCVEKKGDVSLWENSAADFLLLDNKTGGSGKVFDWNLIEKCEKPFFLAGGLNIDNLDAALKQTRPIGIDVSGGVETDGLKDAKKIENFIKKIREKQNDS